ncbi:Deoxyribonuclease/rho motif-related TRAM domain protein [mine drainage metagenome]|uniref:Deoxyribonuclease/rho motif-related TRAM domain protein n=1 Tax=mine drainage metagenome TaxID=410659 RepID=T0YBB9_9ZZZZ
MNYEGENEGQGMNEGRREHRNERSGMRMNPDYFSPKPVKVGDEVTLTIEEVAEKGDGIARKDRFVIFVKGAKKGDVVKVKIVEVKPRFAIGEIVQ